MAAMDLDGFDGVLAFGEVLREAYIRRGWARHAFTWHEAADLRVFRPRPEVVRERDLVWIGNWGDDERTAELQEFLIEPVASLGLSARVHGVRYPPDASARAYCKRAWNSPAIYRTSGSPMRLPQPPQPSIYRDGHMFGCCPGSRRSACSRRWPAGFRWSARRGKTPRGCSRPAKTFWSPAAASRCAVTSTQSAAIRSLRAELSRHGRATIEARHSCAHRVDELLAICRALGRDLCPPQTVAAQ